MNLIYLLFISIIIYLLLNLFTYKNPLDINHLLNIPHIQHKNQDKIINSINKNGVVVIPNILSTSDCDHLLKIINQEEKNEFQQKVSINSDINRCDVHLPLENTQKYIKKIYLKLKHFCDTLLPGSQLIENSAFITYPPSFPQAWHIDYEIDHAIQNDNIVNVMSFGIALDDITDNMGPLEYYKGSHKIWQHHDKLFEKYNIPEEEFDTDEYENIPDGSKIQRYQHLCNALNLKKKICTCKKGSLVIWSWRGIHRGGANSEKRRPVFYFSLMEKGQDPEGTVYSLKKYKNNLTYIVSNVE